MNCWFICIFHFYSQFISRIKEAFIVMTNSFHVGFGFYTTYHIPVRHFRLGSQRGCHIDTPFWYNPLCGYTWIRCLCRQCNFHPSNGICRLYRYCKEDRNCVTNWSQFDYIEQRKLKNNSFDIKNFLPVQTILDDRSAFGPFLTIVVTWAVLGQNTSLICARTKT